MQKNHQQILENIGLSSSEARLYLISLEEGPATVSRLSILLETSRQAIYLLLPNLLDRGLFKNVMIGNKKLFQAMPPSQLSQVVDDVKENIESIIPELISKQTKNHQSPKITVYENKVSMREWYKHFLNKAQPEDEMVIWSTGNISVWYNQDENFYEKYLEKAEKKGVHFRVILPEKESSHQHRKSIGWTVDEYRFIDIELSQNVEQWVWQNEVCLLHNRGKSTSLMVLEGKDVANYYRNSFEVMWKSATKLNW